MNCPKCQHPVDRHGVGGCFFTIIPPSYSFRNPHRCACELTEAEALADAQRAAAIAHLRLITGKRHLFKRPSVGWNRLDNELWAAVEAYRAVGILKGPKP